MVTKNEIPNVSILMGHLWNMVKEGWKAPDQNDDGTWEKLVGMANEAYKKAEGTEAEEFSVYMCAKVIEWFENKSIGNVYERGEWNGRNT